MNARRPTAVVNLHRAGFWLKRVGVALFVLEVILRVVLG